MKILIQKQCESFVNLAVNRLKKYILENNLKGITTGISGGIDSAIVGVIGQKSGVNFKYSFLDCESPYDDFIRAKSLADKFNFKLEKINLTDWYKNSPLLNSIPENHPKTPIALGNIKARLRMISLYQQALINDYIYLDTDDMSEELVGFWTRHGDEGDVKIIQEVTKTELYDLGEYLGVPKIILEAKPGDGLNVTKDNEAIDQLGLDYIYVEYIISRFTEQGFDYNGNGEQLKSVKFLELNEIMAKEINKPENLIKKILERSLATSFKRKYGDYAPHLLPDRKEFGFLEFGTKAFNQKYLSAIIA
jgi:NAD+ synthase